MADGIRLRGLRIQAGERVLVDGVDLDLQAGRLVALVGRSGSGKSLTTRALLGLVDLVPGVVEGRLEIAVGEALHTPYARPSRTRRQRDRAFRGLRGSVLGYLPQDARAALDPLARAGPQVAAAARLGPGDPDPAPWLARAGLQDTERVRRLWPHELSGGMAQRVVIAQALARGSRFLLCDEPTSALDPTVQRAILEALRGLADAGIGVLLITHDLRVLPGLADEVRILDEGRLAEVTTADALRDGRLGSPAGRRLWEATRVVAAGVLG
jgi:peptide/nickel transport system ATP-binding protein